MPDLSSLSKPFPAKDNTFYRLTEYQATQEVLNSHFHILSSGQSSFLTYQNNSFDDLKDWVDAVLESPDQILFAIIDAQSENLIGTSKISLEPDTNSFSIGIMLDQASSVGINIDRIVKGALLNYCFSNYPGYFCKGGCQARNLKSVSFYKYFQFSIDQAQSSSDFVRFSLSKQSFYSRMGSLSSPMLAQSGFDISQADSIDIFQGKLIDCPGYSSLSYFNLMSLCLDIGDHVSIVDLYDLESLKSLSLHLGPSYFSLLPS